MKSDLELVEIYRNVQASGGNWDDIATQSGLKKGTAMARLQGIKAALKEAGKTAAQINRVLPPFRTRLPESGKQEALSHLLELIDGE